MNFQNDGHNECPILYAGSEFHFDTSSDDEEAEIRLDVSFRVPLWAKA